MPRTGQTLRTTGLYFIFCHKGGEGGLHSSRCPRWLQQGNPVMLAGKLEIRVTWVETAGFRITEGNIEEGRQKGKTRI